MRAWIERTCPAGPPIALPEDTRRVALGRGPGASGLVVDAMPGARLFEVAFEHGCWHARALGPGPLPSVNGSPLQHPRPLFDKDVIDVGAVRLTFRLEAPAENDALVAAVAAGSSTSAATLVWADWLQEQGDPLGLRIARAARGERLDHQPWLGPLWQPFVAGALEIDWSLGLAQRAALRAVSDRPHWDWRVAIAQLLDLRVCRFLRTLEVDVLRLEGAAPEDAEERIGRALESLAAQPHLPPVLEHLSLGVLRSPAAHGRSRLPASPALVARAPALGGRVVFRSTPHARLILERSPLCVSCVGLSGGIRALTGTTRLRRAKPSEFHLESLSKRLLSKDAHPCLFAPDALGWTLAAGRLGGELRVNGRTASSYLLVEGDSIELQGGPRLRFELPDDVGAPTPRRSS